MSTEISTAEEFKNFFTSTILKNTSADSEAVVGILMNDIDFKGTEMPPFGVDSSIGQKVYNIKIIGKDSEKVYHISNFRKTLSSNRASRFILGNYVFCNCEFSNIVFENINVTPYSSTSSDYNSLYLFRDLEDSRLEHIVMTGLSVSGTLQAFYFPTYGTGTGNTYEKCAVTSSEIAVDSGIYIFCDRRGENIFSNCITQMTVNFAKQINFINVFKADKNTAYKYCIANNIYNAVTESGKNSIPQEFNATLPKYIQCYSISQFKDIKEAYIFLNSSTSVNVRNFVGCKYDAERAKKDGTAINQGTANQKQLKLLNIEVKETRIFKHANYVFSFGWILGAYAISSTTMAILRTSDNMTTSTKNLLDWYLESLIDLEINTIIIHAASNAKDESEQLLPQSVKLLIDNKEVAEISNITQKGSYKFDNLNLFVQKGTQVNIKFVHRSDAVIMDAVVDSEVVFSGAYGLYYYFGSLSGGDSTHPFFYVVFSPLNVNTEDEWKMNEDIWEGYPYRWVPESIKPKTFPVYKIYIGGANGELIRYNAYIDGKLCDVIIKE